MEYHGDKYNNSGGPLNNNCWLIIIMHDQNYLNNYFSKIWHRDISNYIYSGYALLDKIHPMDHVIDIGCGDNPFKGKIKKLVGVDPANPKADVISTIEDFDPGIKFDVALCLGSINFGSDLIIMNQIHKVNQLLNKRASVYWRLNPGLHDHGNNESDIIDFYPWSFPRLKFFANLYGFKQSNCAFDTDGHVIRLYAEWHR